MEKGYHYQKAIYGIKQQGPRADHFFTTKHTKIWKVGARKSLAIIKNGLHIPQELMANRLGVLQQTISIHLQKMPELAKFVNADLTKGFTVSQLAEKHGWTEPIGLPAIALA